MSDACLIKQQRYSGLQFQASGLASLIQELHKVDPGHGAGVIVALDFITVLLSQKIQLAFGLDTFRHYTDLIVKRKANAQLAQLPQATLCVFGIVHHGAFGKL